MRSSCRDVGALVVKAIIWNIWLARNDCIFNAKFLPVHVLILNIDRLLLSWFSSASEGVQAKLEDSIAVIRQSLGGLGPGVDEVGDATSSGVGVDLLTE